MSPRLRALRALVAVRRRRAQTLQEALAEATQQLDQARLAATEAAARAQQCQEVYLQGEQELQTLVHDAFTLMAQRAMALRNETLQHTAQQAQQIADNAQNRVPPLEEAVLVAKREVMRNEQRIDYFDERIKEMLRDQAALHMEIEEEDAGEAAVARLIAGRRQDAVEDPA